MLVTAVAAAGAGGDSSHNAAYSPAVLASVVNQMFQLRYSRNGELRAGIWGMKLMGKAGYVPRVMIQVMEILKKASGSGGHSTPCFKHTLTLTYVWHKSKRT